MSFMPQRYRAAARRAIGLPGTRIHATNVPLPSRIAAHGAAFNTFDTASAPTWRPIAVPVSVALR